MVIFFDNLFLKFILKLKKTPFFFKIMVFNELGLMFVTYETKTME